MELRKILTFLVVLLLSVVFIGCGTIKTSDMDLTHSFTLIVVDGDGNETHREISTSKETVGDALIENNLISGEEGPYGLYIKEVTGIRADYDQDGTYWAFYVNDEYAMSGVDTTKIEDGATYSLKIEK